MREGCGGSVLAELNVRQVGKSIDRGFGNFLMVAGDGRADLDDLFRNNIGQGVLAVCQAKFSKSTLEGTIKDSTSFRVELALLDQLIDRHLRLLCRRSID